MLSAGECNERSPVHRKSGWSQAERGLDLTGGQAVVTQSRASRGIREDTPWTKHEKPNKREEENGERCMSRGENNQRFWQMKCQVKKHGITEFLP